VLNGYTFDKKMLSREDLPVDWSEEEKTDFIKKQPEQKEKAKKLLLFLFPLIITFAISYVELYIFG
jgi:hypothetical protein